MKRVTKKSLSKLSPSDIGRLKAPELRELLRGARNLFTQQEKKFDKYSQTVYSPALEKMQDYYDAAGKQAVSSMRVNKMRNEVFRLQEFFDSQTSTIPGARKVMIEQDKRIFGENDRGKPLKRMTLQQRTSFWSAYSEFVNMQSASYVRSMGSNAIQQYLGEMIIESIKNNGVDSIPLSVNDFNELKRRIEENREQEEWEMTYDYGDNDVYSGKRPY